MNVEIQLVIYSFVLCDAVEKCVLNLCTDFILCACCACTV